MVDTAFEMENLNSIARVFGAMWSALGAVTPTQIGASTLVQAQELCARNAAAAAALGGEGGGEGGEPVAKMMNQAEKERKKEIELKLGHGVKGITGRQDSDYYALRLSDAEAANGVIVHCNSPDKSRFKLICFDHEGSVRYVQESSLTTDKKFTTANMFLVPFETITSVAPPKTATDGGLYTDPQIFDRMRNMTAEARTLRAGQHLLCVYGDNWLKETPYTLTALLADLAPGVVQAVKDVDTKLREKKKEVEDLEDEYIQAKLAFERVSDRVAEQTAVTEALIAQREVAFNTFIGESLRKYSNKHVGPSGGLPSTAAAAAATTAAAPATQEEEEEEEEAAAAGEVEQEEQEHQHQRVASLTNSGGATVGASDIGRDSKESVPPTTGGKLAVGKGRGKGATAAGGNGITSPSHSKRSSFSFFSGFRRGGGGKGGGKGGEGGGGGMEEEEHTLQQQEGQTIVS